MFKKLGAVLVVVVAVVLAFPILNLLLPPGNAGSIGDLRREDAAFKPVAAVLETKCAVCHHANANLPFYVGFPIASGIVQRDISDGLRFFDFGEVFPSAADPVSEVSLAKLEHVFVADTMPPGRFLLLHWSGGVAAPERQLVEAWIQDVRGRYYATETAASRGTVLQPLVPPAGLDPAMVALGERLYHDPRLSGDDTISCATCHALDKAGTDRMRFSKGIGGAVGGINAPTVFNAGLHVLQFWDGRAADLKEQAGGPVTNPIEMGAKWPDVLAKLSRDPDYARDFGALFADGITSDNVQTAIGIFEESLITTGSKLDTYLMGDAGALTAQEKAGYERFQRVGCASCHVGKALGGQSFERMGRHEDYFAMRGGIGPADLGRFNVTGKERDRHCFKVPSLRNVALTYPYFHDGSTSDLGEAVQVMARNQLGVTFAPAEVSEMVAFLGATTGTYRGKRLD